MHGGLSTGPKTPEGLERSRRARWKHGKRSRAAIEARRIANYQTWERAKIRIEREARRADRLAKMQAKRIARELDRLLNDED
jgi:hypothetical protein